MLKSRGKWVAATATAVLAIGGLTACGSDDDGGSTSNASGESQKQTLKFAYVAGEKTSFGQLWTWWMDEVEKRSGGSIEFDRYWDGSLMEAEEMIDGLKTSRVDIAQVQPTAYGANEFPLTTVAEIPFVSSNFPAVGAAMAELASDEAGPLRKEWNDKGMEPLAWGIGASSPLFSTEPVARVEDLKGMRVRAIGRAGQVVKAAGANIITMPISEVYGSVSRKLISGVLGVPFSFAGPMKFTEIAKNYTDLGLGISSVNGLAISSKMWDELSEEQRTIMREVSEGVPAKAAELEPGFDEASCKAILDADGKVSTFSDAEVKRLSDLSLGAIEDEWSAGAKDTGTDPAAFLAEYRKAVETTTAGEFSDFRTAAATCADPAGDPT